MCSFSGFAWLTWWDLPAISNGPGWPCGSNRRWLMGVQWRVVWDDPQKSQNFLFYSLFPHGFSEVSPFLALLIESLPGTSASIFLPTVPSSCFNFFNGSQVSTFKFKPLHLVEVTVSFNLQLLRSCSCSTQHCSVGGMVSILGGTVLHCARLSCAFQ